jgi:ABC-2 type transport system permease protein
VTAPAVPASDRPADEGSRDGESERLPRFGFLVIARKEFGDHLQSVRFLVVLLILGGAAIVPLYFAAEQIRQLGSETSGVQAIFLGLFYAGPPEPAILRVYALVTIVAPLLGIAFSFDAVNSERADGTLPRLLSQPVHRDDVINGKFLAGLAVIGLVLAIVTVIISAVGMLRLGIVPSLPEVGRILAWFLVTMVYVALWLSFGLLLSVLLRRAATSGLVAFGIWILLSVFGAFLLSLVASFLAPVDAAGGDEDVVSSLQTRQFIERLLPGTLYSEAASMILIPTDQVTASEISPSANFTPATVGQAFQATDPRRIGSQFSLQQSLLVIWPQVVVLLALTVVCFAAAYVAFMRQEVRA